MENKKLKITTDSSNKMCYRLLNAITNIVTIPAAYAEAFISETINNIVDVINSSYGTNYNLSIEHNHPTNP